MQHTHSMSGPTGETPPSDAERAALREFLDYQRDALIGKLDGLTDEQARLTPTASSLSLLSLVKHSAIWERRWFQIIVAAVSFPMSGPRCSRRRSTRPSRSAARTPSRLSSPAIGSRS